MKIYRISNDKQDTLHSGYLNAAGQAVAVHYAQHDEECLDDGSWTYHAAFGMVFNGHHRDPKQKVFKSAEERDKWIQKQISTANSRYARKGKGR